MLRNLGRVPSRGVSTRSSAIFTPVDGDIVEEVEETIQTMTQIHIIANLNRVTMSLAPLPSVVFQHDLQKVK